MTKEISERKKAYANAPPERKGTWHKIQGSITGIFRLSDSEHFSERKMGPTIRSPIPIREDYIAEVYSKYKKKNKKKKE